METLLANTLPFPRSRGKSSYHQVVFVVVVVVEF